MLLFCGEEYVLLGFSHGKRKISLGRMVFYGSGWQTYSAAHACRQVIACIIREQLSQKVLNTQLSSILYSVLRIQLNTGSRTHHSKMETREVSGNDFTDYIAVSLRGSEIILKGICKGRNYFVVLTLSRCLPLCSVYGSGFGT